VQRYCAAAFHHPTPGADVVAVGGDAGGAGAVEALLLSASGAGAGVAAAGRRHAHLASRLVDAALPVASRWAAGQELIARLRADIIYTRWFPRHCKYVALLAGDGAPAGSGEEAPIAPAGSKGETLYRWAMANALAGTYLRADPTGAAGGDVDAGLVRGPLPDLARRAVSVRWLERENRPQTLPRNVRLHDDDHDGEEGSEQGSEEEEGEGEDEEEEEEGAVAVEVGHAGSSASDSDSEDGGSADGAPARPPPPPAGKRRRVEEAAKPVATAAPAAAAPKRERTAGQLRIVHVGMPRGSAPGAASKLRPAADVEQDGATAGAPAATSHSKAGRHVARGGKGGQSAAGAGRRGSGAATVAVDGHGGGGGGGGDDGGEGEDTFFAAAEGDAAAMPVFVEDTTGRDDEDAAGSGASGADGRDPGGRARWSVHGADTSAARWEKAHMTAPRYRAGGDYSHDGAARGPATATSAAAPRGRGRGRGGVGGGRGRGGAVSNGAGGGAAASPAPRPAAPPPSAPAPDLSHLSDRKRRRAERALAYAAERGGGGAGGGGGFVPTAAFYGTDLDPKARLRSERGRGGGRGRGASSGRGSSRGRGSGV
jgi:hypothetical protein